MRASLWKSLEGECGVGGCIWSWGERGVDLFKCDEASEDGRLSVYQDEKGLFVYRPPFLYMRFTQFIES